MTTLQEEITQLINRQQEAWNRADVRGYARHCDENMSFTNITGKTFVGREAFEERHVFLFSSIFKGSRLSMAIERIHFPQPGLALVDIACTVREYQGLPPGIALQKDEALHTCLLEVLVQSENGWRVVAYHNVDQKL
jgi:uncharacterized protein (TIGR02246 family)